MSNHSKPNRQNPNNSSNAADKTGADATNDASSNVNSEAMNAQGTTDSTKASTKASGNEVETSAKETSAKPARETSQKASSKTSQDADTSQAQGLGSISLADILPDVNSENIANLGERVLTYAEEKPLQTIGLATVAGALVGWLLTSRQGHALLRTTASIATPFVSNLISGRGANAQDTASASLKH